jgi:pyruvyl transferase EpsI
VQRFKKATYFSESILDSSRKKAFIFLAADYGNLGDVAITFAQTNFLKKNLDYQVIEVPISKSIEGLWFVKRNIKKGDLVTTVGGGNLGDLYDQIEFIRQLVIKFFPRNKIISFPQTFDFSENSNGLKYLNKAKKVYNSHDSLTFVAREQTSFALMKKHFYNAAVILTPDIVLSLDKHLPQRQREGVVLCMRKDKEKILSKEQSHFIDGTIRKKFAKVSIYDTHINKSELTIQERNEALDSIWSSFKGAELVITDRLHGMIFCYITKTPCIVFQNNNHKVRETYNWIEDCKGIFLMEKFSENKFLHFVNQKTFFEVEHLNLESNYKELVSKII